MHDLIRQEFSSLKSLYFNTAYLGPTPLRARALGMAAIERELDPSFYVFEEWKETPERLRAQLGRLLGGEADLISHHTAVSEVIGHLSLGIPFREGDGVAALRDEYPSNVLPWMLNERQRGYRFTLLSRECALDPDRLRRELPAKTRVFCVSHVGYNTGWRLDVEAIGRVTRERGILFVLDVSQSFGAMPLSAAELAAADIVTGVTYKWLLGPYGHAFAYFSPRALDLVERTHASWMASPHAKTASDLLRYTLETLPGARKFDRGEAPNLVPSALLGGALSLFEEIGLEKIGAHNRELVSYFIAGLPTAKYELLTPKDNRAAILALRRRGGESAGLAAALKALGIDASVREGNLRLSFHLFNTKEQVDALVRGLDAAKA